MANVWITKKEIHCTSVSLLYSGSGQFYVLAQFGAKPFKSEMINGMCVKVPSDCSHTAKPSVFYCNWRVP